MFNVNSSAINLAEKLIILDRDGVINYDSVNYIRTPDELNPIPGSIDAIARLKHAGFCIAVATNQSGIGRHYYTRETLDAIHEKIQQLLAEKNAHIDAIFYCPHLPTDNCDCRKPKPGLITKITAHFDCKLDGVPFIGDSLTDIIAARAVNATPIFLTETNNPFKDRLDALKNEESQEILKKCLCFKNLSDAVNAILNMQGANS